MPAPSDRQPHILEQFNPAVPLPPLNFSVQSGLEPGVIDLHWDLPAYLSQNSSFSILGVNIYRSFDSEYGPFHRLNDIPIGTTFWRDSSRLSLSLQEDVSKSFISRGDSDPGSIWAFKTKHKPIVIQPWLGNMDTISLNVHVTINGQTALVSKIFAESGEVHLESAKIFDVISQTQKDPILPINDTDVVLATYRYQENEVKTDLGKRIFYRITTVCISSNGELIETPLDRAASGDNRSTEQLDYIWREAVRRNRFLLIQGGERVKVFIKKNAGPQCGCYSSTHGQPQADCMICYGSGFIGGYEGPYDIIIAPDDAGVSISQSNRGRNKSHTIETWTSPSPMLSQRDFILKLNGDRYAIGSVRSPTARGMKLQQFFTMTYIDEKDIRYKIPVIDTRYMQSPQTRYIIPGQGKMNPIVTERHAIPDSREFRGNTVVFENTNRR